MNFVKIASSLTMVKITLNLILTAISLRLQFTMQIYSVNTENDNPQEQNASVNGTVNGTVNKTEKDVLELLSIEANLTVADLIQKTGKSERTVKRALASLKEKGMIERIGSDKTGYWKVL